MKVLWHDEVIAEAPKEDLIRIEGSWYFPPKALEWQYFEESDHHTICPWRGEASYYDVIVDGDRNKDAAWYYPEPKDGSIERVKKDFSNYVAFWHGVSQ